MDVSHPARWFRMYAEFATDPKVQMLSETDQRRFVMLLCLRCCNGSVTLQNEIVAFQLRVSVDEWTETKSRLVGFGLVSEDNSPTNWENRQYASDVSTERVYRSRALQKQNCNVTVTAMKRSVETETETETDIAQNKKRSSLIGARLAFEGENLKITARQDSVFRDAFPWVEIPAEYRKMEAWIEANPRHKPKNCGRFAHNWLAKCHKPIPDSSRKVTVFRDENGDSFWINRPPGPPCEANGWKRTDNGVVGKGRPPLVERDENGVEWYIA